MKTRAIKNKGRPLTPWRRLSVLAVFVSAILILFGRAVDIQLLNSDFFERQGDARHIRLVATPAHRGEIVDRNGDPVAVSTPVDSVWLNPKGIDAGKKQLAQLAQLLSIEQQWLHNKISANSDREFVYLKRHVSPELAQKVMALSIPGVSLQHEYRRYYPMGEVAAHVIGFVDIDDNGQEGLELAFDSWLRGKPGKKKVLRDRLGRTFDNIERIRAAQPGKQIRLSIDKKLQYLTYRTLKSAVLKHNAVGGSAVVLDAHSGEVLAMANQPSFNVNDRSQLRPEVTRNRAVTDVFEPGSTMKPFTVAAALESGRWKPHYKVETAPGVLRIQGNVIRDAINYGDLDVGGVIAKSSNVGISKIALHIDEEQQWNMYTDLGLGAATGSGFPGEVSGRLSPASLRSDFQRASLAFGYGVSVTPLQLARAYAAIAADGILRPVSFIHHAEPVQGERIMSADTARAVRKMMQRVVSEDGTGKHARIANYSVAGKTGTVHKFIAGGYAEERYLSVFAGMIPASSPELVMVVMIDEPGSGKHFGGEVAAPVFGTVMTGAVRLLDIAPDQVADDRLVYGAGRERSGNAG